MSKPASGLLTGITDLLRPRRRKQDELIRVVNLTRQTEIGARIAVADRGPRRRKGLLGRTGLEEGEGLWIVPCEAVHTFGMRFAIDLVYLDRGRRVLKVRHGVVPSRISGCFRAHSILELRPGTIAATSTEPGDQMQFHSEPSTDTAAA
ncbi:MAG TPA: DUF192 domain-containing protein [Terracidiphilus sp.]|nr:DUF192 domain-containing protein [Terracidiphilus sp.]